MTRDDWNDQGRAENNVWSTESVQPDCGLDRPSFRLAGHFDWSFLERKI